MTDIYVVYQWSDNSEENEAKILAVFNNFKSARKLLKITANNYASSQKLFIENINKTCIQCTNQPKGQNSCIYQIFEIKKLPLLD